MSLWPVEHFFWAYLSLLLGGLRLSPVGLLLHPPKSDDKYAQKSVQLVRGSSFRSEFLQNPYFSNVAHRHCRLSFLIYQNLGGGAPPLPPGSAIPALK